MGAKRTTNYDHELIEKYRNQGMEYGPILVAMGLPGSLDNSVRSAHRRWQKDQDARAVAEAAPEPETKDVEVEVSPEKFARMESIEDVVRAFDLDPKVWEAVTVKVGGSSWHQSVRDNLVAHSVKILATFKRIRFHEDEAQEVWDDFVKDAADHSPDYSGAPAIIIPETDPRLCELAVYDPHFGMLAWSREVGSVSQDLYSIDREYRHTVGELVDISRLYNVAQFVYPVGNDLFHVNQDSPSGKGGASKRGTPQDLDSRRPKIFTAVRRAVINGIERAADFAPVDVVLVPGNHDPDEVYRLGEVLFAWFRNYDRVRIQYSPNKRQFYRWGGNGFLFTHGEEYARQRDNLPTIMAQEMPPEDWVLSKWREIHTGHNHRRLQGGYYPTAEVEENRGLITRSLPGLTATDAWHHEEGYRHNRAATLLMYHEPGGFAGLFEVQP